MSSLFDGLLRVIALAVEPVASAPGNASLPILLGIAGAAGLTAVVAVGALALAVRAIAASARSASPATLRRADQDADLPVAVTQSDPDADGHTRSRAPGHGVRFPALVPTVV